MPAQTIKDANLVYGKKLTLTKIGAVDSIIYVRTNFDNGPRKDNYHEFDIQYRSFRPSQRCACHLTEIYRWIGRNEEMYRVFKPTSTASVEQTIQRDGYFLARILDLNITDTRMRLILTKDSNPRNKEERTLFRIKEALAKMQKHYKQMRHQSNDLLDYVNFIFGHYGEVKFAYAEADRRAVLQSQAKKSKRLIIDEINEKIELFLDKKAYEKLIVYSHYYIDFFNIAPFTDYNHAAGLLLLYLLMLKGEIEAFRYISFFELLYGEYPGFLKELQNASVNWKEGLAQTLGFVRFIFRFILQGYEKAEAVMNEYKFDLHPH